MRLGGYHQSEHHRAELRRLAYSLNLVNITDFFTSLTYMITFFTLFAFELMIGVNKCRVHLYSDRLTVTGVISEDPYPQPHADPAYATVVRGVMTCRTYLHT